MFDNLTASVIEPDPGVTRLKVRLAGARGEVVRWCHGYRTSRLTDY